MFIAQTDVIVFQTAWDLGLDRNTHVWNIAFLALPQIVINTRQTVSQSCQLWSGILQVCFWKFLHDFGMQASDNHVLSD